MENRINMSEDFLNDLKSLLRLDYGALEAYEVAIKKFSNKKYKEVFEQFKSDHNNHIKSISDFFDKNNYDHPTDGGMKTLLAEGKVILVQLIGDKAILKAMKSNEKETTEAYKNINKHKQVPQDIKKVLEKGYKDEKKHLAWIEKELEEEK